MRENIFTEQEKCNPNSSHNHEEKCPNNCEKTCGCEHEENCETFCILAQKQGFNKEIDESSDTRCTWSDSSSEINMCTNGQEPGQVHSPSCQLHCQADQCTEEDTLKPKINTRLGRRPSFNTLQKSTSFRNKRKTCRFCTRLSKPHEKKAPKLYGHESSDNGSGDNNRKFFQIPQRTQLFPVTTEERRRRCFRDQPKEIFPFRSTESGNYKLDPKQVVFESKHLSVLAADPENVDLNVAETCADEKAPVVSQTVKKQGNENVVTCLYTTVNTGNINFESETSDTFSEAEKSPSPPQKKTSELSLAKMGYVPDNCIDWSSFNLPKKSDLQEKIMENILQRLNTDIQVNIGSSGTSFKCHKLVLQSYSTYFNSVSGTTVELAETEVTKDVFSMIYQWMLHSERESYRLLKRDNILDIFKAAQFLGIKELEDQCWAFMDNMEMFNEEKAFLLYLEARRHGNKDIMELMIPRVQKFFLTLVSSKEFVEFSLEEVCIFLKSNFICIHNEMEVFMAAVRWLNYDWEKRKSHTVEVMKCIRFSFIDPQQLISIHRSPQSPEFQRIAGFSEVKQMIDDGVALLVVKSYNNKGNYDDLDRDLQHLGLTMPVPRNWFGTGKTCASYQDFLRELYHYRSKQRIERRHSKIKWRIEKVTSNDFLASAVLPPASEQKLQKLQSGRHSSLKHAVPQMDQKEVSLLQKLISQEDCVTKEKRREIKRQLCSMAEDSYEKNKHKEAGKKSNQKTQEIIPFSEEMDQAARTIQKAYKNYTRRNSSNVVRLSLENKQHSSGSIKMNSVSKSKSDPSLISGLLRSATYPAGKSEDDALPLELGKETVFLFGGADPFDPDNARNSQRIFGYQASTNSWKHCGYLPGTLFYHAAIFFRGKIYVAGGKNPLRLMKEEGTISNKVWRWEPDGKQWVSLSSMIHARRSFCLVACDNKIFAIGGRSNNDRIMDSVEMYDIVANDWQEVRPLHQARAGAAACELRGRIWVAGGVINLENIATNSVEYYQYQQDKWVLSTNLRFTFAYSVLLPVYGRMYLIGGTIGLEGQKLTGSGKQIDVWDTETQTWNLTSMMSKPRHGHAAAFLKGKDGTGNVLIFGGMSTKHKSVMRNVECWRVEDDCWILGVAPIPYAVSGLTALTLPVDIFG